jgi:HEAT repeat protein
VTAPQRASNRCDKVDRIMLLARPFVWAAVVTAAVTGLGSHAAAQTAPPSPMAQFEKSVDEAIAQGGAAAGLAAYERWMTAAGQENPRALHAIARAKLRAAAPAATTELKVTILQALAADGDAEAAAALNSDALLSEAGAGVIAATGSDRAVAQLIAQLDSPMTNQRKRAIEGLAASKSPRAVTPIINILSDPNVDIRMAGAKALGQLGARQAVGPLKALLDDRSAAVKFEAAAALFALGDMSALPVLRELEQSEHPAIQLAAAQAMRSRPDTGWLALVRRLAANPDPEVRRQAGELLAPHDPAAARAALQPLLQSPNAIDRAAATASYFRTESDLRTLRVALRDPSIDAQTHAALRLLDLTR